MLVTPDDAVPGRHGSLEALAVTRAALRKPRFLLLCSRTCSPHTPDQRNSPPETPPEVHVSVLCGFTRPHFRPPPPSLRARYTRSTTSECSQLRWVLTAPKHPFGKTLDYAAFRSAFLRGRTQLAATAYALSLRLPLHSPCTFTCVPFREPRPHENAAEVAIVCSNVAAGWH